LLDHLLTDFQQVETWPTQEDLRLPSLKVFKLRSHHSLQQHNVVEYP
jgi:hypothetical protein